MNLSKFLHLLDHQSPHIANSPSLDFKHIKFVYGDLEVLNDITLKVTKGERVAVVGPNGAGKSTLFKITAGILKPTGGNVYIFGGLPLSHICVAYLPQRSQVDWHFPVTVLDVVMMGRIGKLGWFRQPTRKDFEIAKACLVSVQLLDLADRQISELSGGQQQRMFIARALAQEAEVILMDEPLNGLDKPSQEIIFYLLDDLKKKGTTVLVAMHDLDLAAEQFDKVMLLNRSLIGFGSAESVFKPENLMKAYGSHLKVIQSENGYMALNDTCCDHE